MSPDVLETGRLLADVGGTNARFAWQADAGAPLTDVRVLPAADFPTLQTAMHAYLAGLGRGRPAMAAIAIANPITGESALSARLSLSAGASLRVNINLHVRPLIQGCTPARASCGAVDLCN